MSQTFLTEGGIVMKGIKDRIVFITGGENGLGRAIAQTFAEEGAKVIIFGIDEDNGTRAEKELNKISDGAMFIKGNVMNNDEIANAMNIIKSKYGRLDFAINNAGITGEIKPFLETSEEQYDKVMGVNVKGIFLSMKNEIPLMLENSFGKIVNVSSEAGSVGFEGFSAYIASKHAINGITKTVAIEYAAKGINVNAIAPGTMLTPLVKAFSKEDQEKLSSIRPTRRLIDVDNVAALTVFLCSEYSNDTVGAVFSMDGGYTAK
jgi:NAD(P)-dependent dehydrogenase (short-subunit alcohol dehydrogenase family)